MAVTFAISKLGSLVKKFACKSNNKAIELNTIQKSIYIYSYLTLTILSLSDFCQLFVQFGTHQVEMKDERNVLVCINTSTLNTKKFNIPYQTLITNNSNGIKFHANTRYMT